MIGKVFDQWTVIAAAENGPGWKKRWLCQCACGVEKPVFATHLIRGKSRSCSRKRHALPKTTPGWSSWQAMKDRCLRPKHPAYHRYGGRGITICPQWVNSFETFYADMGPCPGGLTLERINSDGNYEPSNCRWATRQEQQNNIRTNRRVEKDGKSMTIAEMARAESVPYETMYSRLKRVGAI